jgi:hypothetical protein
MVAVVVATVVFTLSVLVWNGLRFVLAEAERAREAIVSSPWNDLLTAKAFTQLELRARIGCVLSTDDEMLVELRPDAAETGTVGDDLWLLGPANVAAIVALSRWRDTGAVVTIRGGPDRFLLSTPEARVSFSARAPTA